MAGRKDIGSTRLHDFIFQTVVYMQAVIASQNKEVMVRFEKLVL